jgi:hypothetical protein
MARKARFTARSGESGVRGLRQSDIGLDTIGLARAYVPRLPWALPSALAAVALFAGSAARADDLPPTAAAAPIPNLDANYTYVEDADSFRVRINGGAIVRDQGGADGVEHRFIDNADPEWQASVSIRTQNQKPAGKDTISWGVSRLRHLVRPPGADHAGDKAMGDEDPGRIRAFDAGMGDIDTVVAYRSEFKDHSDGKNRHADRYTVLYSQDANANGKDLDSWRLVIRGTHTVRPESKFGKQKNIDIEEIVTKAVNIDLHIALNFTPDVAAQANGFVGIAIESNAFVPSPHASQNAVIDGAAADNSGMTLIQQAAGVGYNQGINVSIAEVAVGDRPFADAQMDMEQEVTGNTILGEIAVGNGNGDGTDVSLAANSGDATASMTAAVRGNVGVTVVQQNAGVANNQHVGMALAVALGPGGVALSDSDMSQAISSNTVQNFGGTKTASLSNSVSRNTGITVVQQSAGNLGNQGVNLAIAGNNGATLR